MLTATLLHVHVRTRAPPTCTTPAPSPTHSGPHVLAVLYVMQHVIHTPTTRSQSGRCGDICHGGTGLYMQHTGTAAALSHMAMLLTVLYCLVTLKKTPGPAPAWPGLPPVAGCSWSTIIDDSTHAPRTEPRPNPTEAPHRPHSYWRIPGSWMVTDVKMWYHQQFPPETPRLPVADHRGDLPTRTQH